MTAPTLTTGAAVNDATSTVIADIVRERIRAGAERPNVYDDLFVGEELAQAAAHLASIDGIDVDSETTAPPWADELVLEHQHDRRAELVAAAGLLVREIERIDRAEAKVAARLPSKAMA